MDFGICLGIIVGLAFIAINDFVLGLRKGR